MKLPRPKWVSYAVLSTCIVLQASIPGCSNVEDLNYETNSNRQELLTLKGKKLLVLAFEHSDDVFIDADTLEPKTAKTALVEQKIRLLLELKPLFNAVDATGKIDIPERWELTTQYRKLIGKSLRDMKADAALIVTSAYGYKMAGAVIPNIIESLAGKNNKKSVRVAFGPSSVQFYYFASITYILNKDGDVIWKFTGKIAALPEPKFDVDSLARSFAGLDPANKALAKIMNDLGNNYTEFLVWLLRADLEGSERKNFFTDYPENKKDKKFGIYPASDRSHVPILVSR